MTVRCEHAVLCPGCPLLGQPYAEQLVAKAAQVRSSLDRHGDLREVPVAPTLGAHEVMAYRTRVKLMVGPRGELGLFGREGDHVVVDVPGCQVLTPALAEVAAALRSLLSSVVTASPVADRVAQAHTLVGAVEGSLRAVDLRELRDPAPGVWVTLVVTREALPDDAALRTFAAALMARSPHVRGVFANRVAADAVQVLGPETLPIAGEREGWDRIAGVRLLAAPGSFVQAHRGQAYAIAVRLRDEVRCLEARLGRRPRVLDLFAGSGAWGLGAAAVGAEVMAVESFAPAADRIEAAAKAAGLVVATRRADAEREVQALARAGERFDLVLVNPPRRGLSPLLRAGLRALAPARVAYVSCDPGTLGRDLAHLARLGLWVEGVLPVDMIPLTGHVESLAWLAPGPPPPPSVLFEDAGVVAIDKPAHEGAAELAARVRAVPGLATVVPLFAPAFDESGVALFAREAQGEGEVGRFSARAVVAVKGVLRKKGSIQRNLRGHRAQLRYVRSGVGRGHSRVQVECALADVPFLGELLASIGHPPLGDRGRLDRRTLRHLSERYALDRSFVHIASIALGDQAALSPLPGDLALVSERLAFP